MRTIPVLTKDEEIRAIDVINQLIDDGFSGVLDRYSSIGLMDWKEEHWKLINKCNINFCTGMSKVAILDANNPRWVIKSNLPYGSVDYCREEEENYKRACAANIEDCFAATYYLTNVEGFDFYVQERVYIDEDANSDTFCNYISNDLDPSEFESLDAYRETVNDIVSCEMNDEDRIYAMLQGNECNIDIQEVVNFIDEYAINDLHAGNWGVTNDGFVVIVDYSGY